MEKLPQVVPLVYLSILNDRESYRMMNHTQHEDEAALVWEGRGPLWAEV